MIARYQRTELRNQAVIAYAYVAARRPEVVVLINGDALADDDVTLFSAARFGNQNRTRADRTARARADLAAAVLVYDDGGAEP